MEAETQPAVDGPGDTWRVTAARLLDNWIRLNSRDLRFVQSRIGWRLISAEDRVELARIAAEVGAVKAA